MWITMVGLPITLPTLLLGLAFFRFFDIVKPGPVAMCERRVKGGLGVMLDDAVAGVLAQLCVRLCLGLYVVGAGLWTSPGAAAILP